MFSIVKDFISVRKEIHPDLLNQLKALLSQAAACDGLVYSVNLNGQNMGTQGYALPLFED